jgi:hypothetical protein
MLRIISWFPGQYRTNLGFENLFNSLPSFAHTYAFALFTMAILQSGRRQSMVVCLCWLFLESLFEFGQHSRISTHFAGMVTVGSPDSAVVRAVMNYFVYGVFDRADLISILIGAVAALGTSFVFVHKGGDSCVSVLKIKD